MLKKIIYSATVILGVLTLVFLLFRGMGDPAKLVAGQNVDPRTLENIRKELYLDQPGWKQYLLYLNDLSPISFHTDAEISGRQLRGFFFEANTTRRPGIKWPYLGRSFQSKKEVGSIIAHVMPATLVLALAAMILATIIGISLGVLAAVKKGTLLDHGSIIGSIAGISAPSFYMAIPFAYIFGLWLHDYTGLPVTGSLYAINEVTGERYIEIKNLVLPALTLGIRPMAIITQLTRSSMLDVLSQDFIRTARAKGLSEHRVLWKHALPNALNPVLTSVTGWFAEMLAGAFFVEYIFGWNGLGRVTVQALEKLDYPVLMGSLLVSALLFVLINLLADMLYRLIDPRIR
ncbi:MAG TPA: ABC transporter permease [Chitinophagaceae bacterium]|nr:ABC transporter permease [Chitinophagaceae bacterium]